ncbi:TPA: hypothetical protein ACH3X3_002881 [Trebouxia sp. C0006]
MVQAPHDELGCLDAEVSAAMADPTGLALQRGCLSRCARTGDLVLLNKLLASGGIEVDYKTPEGDTALYSAALCGHLEIVQALLAHRADATMRCSDGWTALHVAAHKSIVAELLKYGADIASGDDKLRPTQLLLLKAALCTAKNLSPIGSTPLHFAVEFRGEDVRMIDALLAKAEAATIDAKSVWGWSPLHFACAAGHADMVALLLSHGADVMDTLPVPGRTLLHMVCQGPECGNSIRPSLLYLTSFLARWHVGVPQNTAAYPDIVNILLSHSADVNARDSEGDNQVQQASYAQLLDLSANVLTSASLGFCCHMELIPMVPPQMVQRLFTMQRSQEISANLQMLLEYGADVKTKNKKVRSRTVLHYLAKGLKLDMVAHLCKKLKDQPADPQLGCMDPHIDAVLKRFVAVLRQLLSAGADLEAVDDEGMTPLHVAVKHEHPDLVEILLSHGARVNATNHKGFKMLQVTVRAIENAESVSLLLAHGADPAILDNQGCTAISLAEHSNCANISDMLRNAHPITHDIDSARSCSVDHIAARDADGAVGSLSRLSSMGSLLE